MSIDTANITINLLTATPNRLILAFLKDADCKNALNAIFIGEILLILSLEYSFYILNEENTFFLLSFHDRHGGFGPDEVE